MELIVLALSAVVGTVVWDRTHSLALAIAFGVAAFIVMFLLLILWATAAWGVQ